MYVRIFFVLMTCFLFSCNQEKKPPVENKPEAVARAWQQYLDESKYEEAIALSSPEAMKFVRFLKELENDLVEMDTPISRTIIKDMKCEVKEEAATCDYIDEFGKKDHFDLIKINGNWSVHLLLEEELNPELEQLLEDSEEILEEELKKNETLHQM